MRKSALKTIFEDMHSFGIQLFIHNIRKLRKIITNVNVGQTWTTSKLGCRRLVKYECGYLPFMSFNEVQEISLHLFLFTFSGHKEIFIRIFFVLFDDWRQKLSNAIPGL